MNVYLNLKSILKRAWIKFKWNKTSYEAYNEKTLLKDAYKTTERISALDDYKFQRSNDIISISP